MDKPTVIRLEDLPADHPMELLERRRVMGEHAMLSYVKLTKGFRLESHHHANEQMAVVMSGKICFGLADGSSVTLGPGEVLHIPPDAPHSAEALEDTVVLDVFSPPSATTGIDRS